MKTPEGNVSDFDEFNHGLSLNYEDIGGYCIVAYAKSLAEQPDTPPEPRISLVRPSNVYYLDEYRHGDEAA